MVADAAELRSADALASIEGWFYWADQQVFRTVLGGQQEPGTLVELGCYLGKSTVLMGDYQREGEPFVVIDLFGRTDLLAGDTDTTAEVDRSYKSLSQQAFEANYLGVHPSLPTVVVGPSSVVVDHVEPGSARFVHIDASHLYEHVRTDIASAATMVRPGGVIALDDYRSVHTPGVSAAIWSAVERGEIIPVAHTHQKMYCVASAPEELRERVEQVCELEELTFEVQQIAGHPVQRIMYTPEHHAQRAREKVEAQERAEARLRASIEADRDMYAAQWARSRFGAEEGMSPARLAARLVARNYLPSAAKRAIRSAKRHR